MSGIELDAMMDRQCTAQLQGYHSQAVRVEVEETLTVSLHLMEFCLITSMVTGLCHGGDGSLVRGDVELDRRGLQPDGSGAP